MGFLRDIFGRREVHIHLHFDEVVVRVVSADKDDSSISKDNYRQAKQRHIDKLKGSKIDDVMPVMDIKIPGAEFGDEVE